MTSRTSSGLVRRPESHAAGWHQACPLQSITPRRAGRPYQVVDSQLMSCPKISAHTYMDGRGIKYMWPPEVFVRPTSG